MLDNQGRNDMRLIMFALCVVIMGLSNTAYAVGINQQWGLGSALPDGLRDNAFERQREEVARTIYNNTRPRLAFQTNMLGRMGEISESIFPGALGYFEQAGRTIDSWHERPCLAGTLLAGKCELTGSAERGDQNIFLQFRAPIGGWGN